jgi:hypothetical protein
MTEPEPEPGHNQPIEEPPPILGSWRNLYLVLIVELALLTLAGYLLSWWAA